MSATYCVACKKYSWPVTPHCKFCSAPTVLKPVPKRNGRVVEFCSIPSSDKRETMALIELGAIRVVGRIVNPQKIKVGCKVVLKNCGVSPDGAPYYAFEIVG